MFLLPLIVATTCDICTIYLYSYIKTVLQAIYENDDYSKDDDIIHTILIQQQSTILYLLVVSSSIRLACLVPYLFHLSTGRRIKQSILYKLFHGVCIITIVWHVLFRRIIPVDGTEEGDGTEIVEKVGWMMVLGFLGCMSHLVMLHHVGSTAPEDVNTLHQHAGNHLGKGSSKNRMIAYAAAWRYTAHWEDMGGILVGGQPQTQQEPFLTLKKMLSNRKKNSSNSTNNSSSSTNTSNDGIKQEDDLIKDLQTRLAATKRHWNAKLDELKVATNLHKRIPQFQQRGSNFHTFITPFRVLLHLYAYQDVLTNGELDAVFNMEEDGGIVTFYIPQLLTFLLHGAYLNAPQLEYWILERCGESLYFAHKCFWFLRGWCLYSQKHVSYTDDLLDGGSLCTTSSHESRYPVMGVHRSRRRRTLSVGAQLSSSARLSASSGEEYRMIEDLMLRVMDRAEAPAAHLMHGKSPDSAPPDPNPNPNNDSKPISSPFAVADAVKNRLVPICPTAGRPSSKHLDTLTASSKYGFLPQQHLSHTNSSNQLLADSLFLATPQFFDALLSIADDLMLVAKPNRTSELRNLLQRLEYDLLPSNVVYIPLNNVHHRVWRTVCTESIALSTNERVPCIVTLEVVSFDQDLSREENGTPTTRGNRNDDREVLHQWKTRRRPPQRHNTLLEKLRHNTQKSFKKIQGDMTNHINLISRNTNHYCAPTCTNHPFQDRSTNASSSSLNYQEEQEPSTPPRNENAHNVELSHKPLPSYYQRDTLLPHNANTNPKDGEDHDQQQQNLEVSYDYQTLSPQVSSAMGQWVSPPAKKSTFDTSIHNAPSIPPFYNIPALPDFHVSPTKLQQPHQLPSLIQRQPSYDTLQISLSSNSSTASLPTQLFSSTATTTNTNTNTNTPKPPTVVFKENWSEKCKRLRQQSAYGTHKGWSLLPILIKSNDDLRQEQLASQLIHRMATILARANIPVWLYPYEILALTHRGGIIEAVPDTISLDSLKRNDPHFISLKDFFDRHFAPIGSDAHADARANFVESLAAYSMICYLLQIKDRHNGNILLDNKGHIIHIDFGFLLLSSPGQNSGFENAPFKLTSDFVSVMDGPESRLFLRFRDLCIRTFLELRKHCYQIILMVEMITEGNADLPCFCNRPKEAIQQLRHRFRLDLSDTACVDYVQSLIDESLENWRTRWYDRYQRFCVGVL